MKKGSKRGSKPKIDRKAKLMSWLIVLFLVLAIMNLVIGIAYLSNMQIQVSKPIMPVFAGTIPYIYAVDFLTAVVLVGMQVALPQRNFHKLPLYLKTCRTTENV